MLFISSDLSKPKRIQGSFTTDEELSSVVRFIKRENPAQQEDELEGELDGGLDENEFQSFLDEDVEDDMYGEALEVVREAKKASASLLQRRLRVGYARAARLLDIMEERGVVGPGQGAKPREVFIDGEDQEKFE